MENENWHRFDGVLTNIELFQLEYGSKFCYENNIGSLIDNAGYEISEIFECSEEADERFWEEYFEVYCKIPARIYASEVISKLKEEHEVYIITAREYTIEKSDRGHVARNILLNWLKDNKIEYDKIIFTEEDKLKNCLDYNIDIMIEDKPENINNISRIIPVIAYDAEYNRTCLGKNIIKCYTWYDIYDKIKKYSRT